MGLFYSARIELSNRPQLVKFRAILMGLYGVYCFDSGGGYTDLLQPEFTIFHR